MRFGNIEVLRVLQKFILVSCKSEAYEIIFAVILLQLLTLSLKWKQSNIQYNVTKQTRTFDLYLLNI